MSKMNDGSKYIFKLTAVIIVVIINVIALIAVFTTVGGTVVNLKSDIKSGKISKSDVQSGQTEITEDPDMLDGTEEQLEDDMDLDFSQLFKVAISDKNVVKSLVLMVVALILLAGAIYILVKLK